MLSSRSVWSRCSLSDRGDWAASTGTFDLRAEDKARRSRLAEWPTDGQRRWLHALWRKDSEEAQRGATARGPLDRTRGDPDRPMQLGQSLVQSRPRSKSSPRPWLVARRGRLREAIGLVAPGRKGSLSLMGFLRWRPDEQSEWLTRTVRGSQLMMVGYLALGHGHSRPVEIGGRGGCREPGVRH